LIIITIFSPVFLLLSCATVIQVLNPPIVNAYGFKEYSGVQPPFRGAGERISLNNISNAKDVTYEQVKAFIMNDATDREPYVLSSQVCAEFAKKVHDNAESNGIRCGWVSIDLNDTATGHACNVFNTTDKGLVFVDCTGADVLRIPNTSSQNSETINDFDKIAYISIGYEYGAIPISVASGMDYSYYTEYQLRRERFMEQLDSYNAQVTDFNEESKQFKAALGGRTIIQDPTEYKRLKSWQDSLAAKEIELNRLKSDLDTLHAGLADFYFKPMGIVKEVGIYW
jgi:hypothetical protein